MKLDPDDSVLEAWSTIKKCFAEIEHEIPFKQVSAPTHILEIFVGLKLYGH